MKTFSPFVSLILLLSINALNAMETPPTEHDPEPAQQLVTWTPAQDFPPATRPDGLEPMQVFPPARLPGGRPQIDVARVAEMTRDQQLQEIARRLTAIENNTATLLNRTEEQQKQKTTKFQVDLKGFTKQTQDVLSLLSQVRQQYQACYTQMSNQFCNVNGETANSKFFETLRNFNNYRNDLYNCYLASQEVEVVTSYVRSPIYFQLFTETIEADNRLKQHNDHIAAELEKLNIKPQSSIRSFAATLRVLKEHYCPEEK